MFYSITAAWPLNCSGKAAFVNSQLLDVVCVTRKTYDLITSWNNATFPPSLIWVFSHEEKVDIGKKPIDLVYLGTTDSDWWLGMDNLQNS